MPLVSKGLGLSAFAGRQISSHITPGARSIHIPPPQSHSASTAGKALKQTRNLITRFFTHLTTPGFSHPIVPRSIYTTANAARQQTLQQGLSLPVRYALSRPLGAPYLPRPAAVPRSMTQVGLGTARNFSTTRPIFQHLAENVPVAGRSLYEAPSKVKQRKEMKEHKQMSLKAEKENKSTKSMMKPKQDQVAVKAEADLEHYFPAPAIPAVSTYLLIPLAPTPTSRYPLSSSPSATESPLLPLPALGHMHVSHDMHSLRVSSLFSRLDAARVWERNVACSAHGDRSGLCTVLKVEFRGWTEAMVRDVIGEGGRGWCKLEEVRDEEECTGSDLSSVSSTSMESSGYLRPPLSMDPADSLVLPQLDFSALFPVRATSPPLFSYPPSPALSGSDMDISSPPFSDLDMLSDSGSENGLSSDDGNWSVPRSLSSSRSSSWVGFSSDFARRAEEHGGAVEFY